MIPAFFIWTKKISPFYIDIHFIYIEFFYRYNGKENASGYIDIAPLSIQPK